LQVETWFTRKDHVLRAGVHSLVIGVRELDCLASGGIAALPGGALPVYVVRPETLPAFLETRPPAQAAFVRASGYSAKSGAVGLLPGNGGVAGALLGLGDGTDPFAFGALPFALPEGSVCAFAGKLDCPEAATLAYLLGAYRFDQLRSAPGRAPARLIVPAGAGNAISIATATWLVRDLINLPANLLGPSTLAQTANRILTDAGADVSVVSGEALERAYPLVATVGRGSVRAPHVVVARWQSPRAAANAPFISLCGKGVCFDTGGYDLKPAAAMLRMKKDMGGAAIALGLAKLLIENDVPIRLEVRLGCVENCVSGDAMRPLDIVKSRRGLSVAIGNTDAEGRLVLADLLAEASDANPDLLLDFATLTGAARVALGTDIAAVFCNDDALAGEIATASRIQHDPVWRMPLWNGYNSLLESHGCDLNNVSDKPYAGAIIAALFLQRFVTPGTRWAHFDVYAANDSTRPGRPEGGEAQGMRAAWGLISRIVNIAAEKA
jgi:leucyl aminopeptidase